jgi:hypothetical protein
MILSLIFAVRILIPSYYFESLAGSSISYHVILIMQYSGGQPSKGQGGYYGSGGARVLGIDDLEDDPKGRNKVLALAADVQTIQMTVKELDVLENLLRSEEESAAAAAAKSEGTTSSLTSKMIELKNSIKKLITSPDVVESLNNLEIQGAPVWGLSSEEREMIVYLRDKMNES